MAGKSVVRELVTLWGFDIDKKPLQELDAGINAIKGSLKAIGIATAATAGAIGLLLNEAGKQEQTNIAFETMVGNAERAKVLINDLQQFAARTPFTIPGIEKNAKLLLGMGIEVNKLLPSLKFLGDVSAGLSVPLDRLALNFGQVKTQGKLTGRELRDFAIAGVPLLSELAKNLGKTKSEVTKMVSAGTIGFDKVEQAFISMSSEGGRFNNLMIKQAASLKGLLSNAQDFLIIFARELGQEILPAAKEIVTAVIAWAQANRKLLMGKMKDFLKTLVGFLQDLIDLIVTAKRAMDGVVGIFGGWNNVLKGTFKIFTAIMGLGLLAGIGLMTKALIGLALGWKTMGMAALWAQIKLALIPIAIGAIVVAIALIAEDILAFSQGRDSVFGRMITGIGEIFKQLEEKFQSFGRIGQILIRFLLTPIRLVIGSFKSILTLVDIFRGKISKTAGLIKIAKQMANVSAFGGDGTLGSAFGLDGAIGSATDQVERGNTPLAGLGGGPLRQNGGEPGKVVTVEAKNELSLNVTGMDPKSAEDLVFGTINDQFGGMLRDAVRDGESQVER